MSKTCFVRQMDKSASLKSIRWLVKEQKRNPITREEIQEKMKEFFNRGGCVTVQQPQPNFRVEDVFNADLLEGL